MGEGLVQSLVYKVYRIGLSAQPCGAPVLVVSAGDVVVPTRTACSLSLRKLSRIWIRQGGGGGGVEMVELIVCV